MIHRISVTVTQRGLQFNASDSSGQVLEQVWLGAGDPADRFTSTFVPGSDCLAVWQLSESLDRLANGMIPLAARLVRSLRLGQLPRMRSLTFDIVARGVDCHICLCSFEEVILHYPLPAEGSSVRPLVRAGELSSLPASFLSIFNQAVKSRFCPLARQLAYDGSSRARRCATGQDAA